MPLGERPRLYLSPPHMCGRELGFVHGQPADMDAFVEICARHEVPLIEDAAESLGATHKGRHIVIRLPDVSQEPRADASNIRAGDGRAQRQ